MGVELPTSYILYLTSTRMPSIHLIFPHQLYKNIQHIPEGSVVYLVEEYLFFKYYKFHKQKIRFHRASMSAYKAYLLAQNFSVTYLESTSPLSDVRLLIQDLHQRRATQISYSEVSDDWLQRRITSTCQKLNIAVTIFPSQLFLNTERDIRDFFADKKRYSQTDFYVHQRKKHNVLLEADQKPVGGKWTFDTDNRLKYPNDRTPPVFALPSQNSFYQEATEYVSAHFSDNFGELSDHIIYPTTHKEAEVWFDEFLETRFHEFGIYEDAIVQNELLLHHSLLTPVLNVGLLIPLDVIQKAVSFAENHGVPINSLEGFVRQIMGWREFIHGMYLIKGGKQRIQNYWKFDKKIPASFYNGTTGIAPIDDCIKKVTKTAYNHHIERLMIISNFMLLCEFDPDEVHRWFMEFYIDAYDWVMVPNVYGMGQFADGGIMCTKPYISGSNYIFKMSDYKKGGEWADIWDALFWRFMDVHRSFFLKNPRLGMLVKTYDKMNEDKKTSLTRTANRFLESL